MRTNVSFFRSFYNDIKKIPEDRPELKLQLYDAILTYGLDGVEIEVDWTLQIGWETIKAQIDASNKRKDNAQKGGRNSAEKRSQQAKVIVNRKQTPTKAEVKVKQPASNIQPNIKENIKEKENTKTNTNINSNDNINNTPAAAENSDAVNYYLNYINPAPSHTLIQTIESYILDGMTDECLIAIFEYCRDNNKTNWAYIKKAVEGSFSDGVRTLEDYRRKREEREKARAASQPQATTKKKSAFHNFEQREYPSDDLDNLYFEQMFGEETEHTSGLDF